MARKTQSDDFYFEGFESPNTTPVPDVVFDVLLARLGEAELKALLYIIRRTFGFKRDRDSISFNQFLRGITTRDGRVLDQGCGIKDRTTLSKALKSLEAKGVVQSEKGVDDRGENATTVYSLRFRREQPAGVVGNSYYRGMNHPPRVVGIPYPQETVKQETDLKDSKLRKRLNENKRNDGVSAVEPGHQAPNLSDAHQIRPIPSRSVPPPTEEQTAQRSGGLESLADALKRRQIKPVTYNEDRQAILAYVQDFAREFNDQAPLRSSVSRAYNLFKQSGTSLDVFIQAMYQARAVTKERSASIRSKGNAAAGSISAKNKTAYWFSVLEDVLGLKEPQDKPGPPH